MPREALDGIARDEDLLRNELGDDRSERRHAERRCRSEDRIRHVEVPYLQGAREPQDRDHADGHSAAKLRHDDERSPRDAIGDGAADQKEHEARAREDRDESSELERRTAKLQDLEGVRDIRNE